MRPSFFIRSDFRKAKAKYILFDAGIYIPKRRNVYGKKCGKMDP